MSEGHPRLPPREFALLALRNLERSPRRTGLTVLSMALGLAALTLLAALNDGWLEQMRDNFILALTGHVQIHARGFEDSQNLRDYIPDPGPVIAVVRHDPAVAAWTLRVRASGLAAVAGNASGVRIMGVDPEQETWVTHMHQMLSEGAWLRPGVARDLLLGVTVAHNLGARVGDRVVLTAQRPNGEMASEVFYLRGILASGAPQIDRVLALVNLGKARRWLHLGEGVTDVVVRALTHAAAGGMEARLRRTLPEDRYEILSWRELDPMVSQWLKFSDAYGLVLILIVAALVLVEVLNTQLMALHERTRELGVMLALGTRPRQLFVMVLLEGLMLILAGAILGYALGIGAVFWLGRDGIDLSAFGNAFRFFYMSPLIHPLITAESAGRILGTTFAAALVAGLYPAWWAARLPMNAALRRI